MGKFDDVVWDDEPSNDGFDGVVWDDEVVASEPEDTSWLETVQKGMRNTEDAMNAGRVHSGEMSNADFAVELADNTRLNNAIPYSQDRQDFDKAWEEADGFWESTGAALSNPVGAARLTAEQAGNMLPAIGGAAGGAALGSAIPLVGTAAGAIVGGALGGGSVELGAELITLLNKSGVDTTDSKAIEAAMTPDFMSNALERGALRGGAIVAVDLLTMGVGRWGSSLAGKTMMSTLSKEGVDVGSKEAIAYAVRFGNKNIRNAADAYAKSKTKKELGKVAAGVFALEALGEPVGELAAQAAVGDKLDYGEAGLEFIGGFGATVAATGVQTALGAPETLRSMKVFNKARLEKVRKDRDEDLIAAREETKRQGGDDLDAVIAESEVSAQYDESIIQASGVVDNDSKIAEAKAKMDATIKATQEKTLSDTDKALRTEYEKNQTVPDIGLPTATDASPFIDTVGKSGDAKIKTLWNQLEEGSNEENREQFKNAFPEWYTENVVNQAPAAETPKTVIKPDLTATTDVKTPETPLKQVIDTTLNDPVEATSFTPTHELADGTQVNPVEDEDNVWIDAKGDEYIESDVSVAAESIEPKLEKVSLNNEVVQTRKDSKGREIVTTSESTTYKDGLTKTKYSSARDGKKLSSSGIIHSKDSFEADWDVTEEHSAALDGADRIKITETRNQTGVEATSISMTVINKEGETEMVVVNATPKKTDNKEVQTSTNSLPIQNNESPEQQYAESNLPETKVEAQDDIQDDAKQNDSGIKYPVGIKGFGNDLTEGGGVAYTYDETGKIAGMLPSVNPEWFKDNSFTILNVKGDDTVKVSPTVKEVKLAISNHFNNKTVTKRQHRILEALTDMAMDEQTDSIRKEEAQKDEAIDDESIDSLLADGILTEDSLLEMSVEEILQATQEIEDANNKKSVQGLVTGSEESSNNTQESENTSEKSELLSNPTPEELSSRDEAQVKAEADKKAADTKAKVDKEAEGGLELTGSDRAADANASQDDLFSQPSLKKDDSLKDKPKEATQDESSNNYHVFKEFSDLAKIPEGSIYKDDTGDKTRWLIRGARSNGAFETIFDTAEEAEAEIVLEKRRRDDKAKSKIENDERENTEKAIADAKRLELESIDGFADERPPIQLANVRKALSKMLSFDGKVQTIKEKVRELVAEGVELKITEVNKVQPMSRRKYNQATQREQDSHDERIKNSGTKKVYYVGGYDLGKTAHGYAEHLLNTRDKATKPKSVIQKQDSLEKITITDDDGTRYNASELLAATDARLDALNQLKDCLT